MITADLKCNQLLSITFLQSNHDYFRLHSITSNIFSIYVNTCIIYRQQDICACKHRLSLLIIQYMYYETYLVLVIDICYIVNLIYYKMIWWSVKWCIHLNRN